MWDNHLEDMWETYRITAIAMGNHGSILELMGTNTGWWFGTCFIFSYIGNVIIPIDELRFFRGVAEPPTRIHSRSLLST